MKKSRFPDSQILAFIRQAESGMPSSELRTEQWMRSASFYRKIIFVTVSICILRVLCVCLIVYPTRVIVSTHRKDIGLRLKAVHPDGFEPPTKRFEASYSI